MTLSNSAEPNTSKSLVTVRSPLTCNSLLKKSPKINEVLLLLLPMCNLLLPVSLNPASAPMKTLLKPLLPPPALRPNAVLLLPLILLNSAFSPTTVLKLPLELYAA